MLRCAAMWLYRQSRCDNGPQVIEPRLYGSNLDLHPATILLALLSWGVLWGVPGVIVAVPITATIKIWMSHRTEDPLGTRARARPFA